MQEHELGFLRVPLPDDYPAHYGMGMSQAGGRLPADGGAYQLTVYRIAYSLCRLPQACGMADGSDGSQGQHSGGVKALDCIWWILSRSTSMMPGRHAWEPSPNTQCNLTS
jgi:hypothetical protein